MSFLVKVLLVYIAWHLLHTYLWATPDRKAAWEHLITPSANMYASLTSYILNLFGYHSYTDGVWIQIDTTHHMWIAEHCQAIPAMVVFAASMLLFRGRAIDKLWFIPFGVLMIFLLNLFRLVSLSLIRAHVLTDSVYELYHRYVFLCITYGLILLMVAWWMNRTTRMSTATEG